MSTINLTTSFTGHLYDKFKSTTAVKDKESKINNLKITATITGNPFFLAAITIEIALRYFIAYTLFAISFALKDHNFSNKYVIPAFEDAKQNKEKFIEIKNTTSLQYKELVKPFLEKKVEIPS